MGPMAGLEVCGKFRPIGILSPNLPARRELLCRQRYPGPHKIHAYHRSNEIRLQILFIHLTSFVIINTLIP